MLILPASTQNVFGQGNLFRDMIKTVCQSLLKLMLFRGIVGFFTEIEAILLCRGKVMWLMVVAT